MRFRGRRCFSAGRNGEMERYSTWDEAEAGHKRMVQRVAVEALTVHSS